MTTQTEVVEAVAPALHALQTARHDAYHARGLAMVLADDSDDLTAPERMQVRRALRHLRDAEIKLQEAANALAAAQDAEAGDPR